MKIFDWLFPDWELLLTADVNCYYSGILGSSKKEGVLKVFVDRRTKRVKTTVSGEVVDYTEVAMSSTRKMINEKIKAAFDIPLNQKLELIDL